MFGQAAAQQQNQFQNQNTGDIEVPNPPEDAISCLAWSRNNHLAVGSWDKTIRVWRVTIPNAAYQTPGQQAQVSAEPFVQYGHDAPVLCLCFSFDGGIIFSGTCDNKIKMRNLQTGQELIIGQHNSPVKEVRWCEEHKLLISGSWDKTIKFWTGQSATPAFSLDLPERVYSMDLQYPLLVVGMAERKLFCYDLQNMQNGQPQKQGETALKMQTRCVAAFPDKQGYAVGSIEGRCSIAYLNDPTKNFAFKCHRNTDDIFAVNSIAFNPQFGTFATAGSDGCFTFWDKDNRQRLKQFHPVGAPITATGFNHTGTLYAYACSYDWSKGHEHNHPNIPRRIFLHRVEEAEIKPKPSTAGQRTGQRR